MTCLCSHVSLNVVAWAAENATKTAQQSTGCGLHLGHHHAPSADDFLSRHTMLAHAPEPATFCSPGPNPGNSAPALLAAAELQDHLMVVSNDLDRLRRLLDDASESLMNHFTQANDSLACGDVQQAHRTIGGAITALQFQDMASQLIVHTSKRLRNCADRLARDAMGDDDDEGGGQAVIEDAPLRPNPVTQDEMDAGSIDLF
jgi:hypothetical protein